MKPLNQKERTTLYWQFLILYLVTILLVILAVSFYFKVNELAVDQLKESKQEKVMIHSTSLKFRQKVTEIDSMLVLMDKGNDITSEEKNNIEDAIRELTRIKTDSPSFMDSLYMKIAARYFSVYDDKLKIRSSGASEDAVKQLSQDLREAKKELEQCNSQLNVYKALAPGR